MQNQRFQSLSIASRNAPEHYLGLADHVHIARAARRLRAEALSKGLNRGLRGIKAALGNTARALFGRTPESEAAPDFKAEDLRAMGVRPQHIPAALIGQAVGNAVAGVIGRVSAVMRRRKAEAELFALDDRSLRDLGLTRAAIPAAVAGTLYRADLPSNENSNDGRVQALKPRAEAAA